MNSIVLNKFYIKHKFFVNLFQDKSEAKQIRITFEKGGKAFNPLTGLTTSDTGFENTITPSTDIGTTIWVSTQLFLAADEETMDIQVETPDEDENVIRSWTFPDIPFKQNRVTALRGPMFQFDGASGSFSIETAMDTSHSVNF